MSESEHWEALLAQLELLDERRLRTAEPVQVYQNWLTHYGFSVLLSGHLLDRPRMS